MQKPLAILISSVVLLFVLAAWQQKEEGYESSLPHVETKTLVTWQLNDLAGNEEMRKVKEKMEGVLMQELQQTEDPRITVDGQYFEELVLHYRSK